MGFEMFSKTGHQLTFQKPREEWTEEMAIKSKRIMAIHHRHENEPEYDLNFYWSTIVNDWVQI